VPAPPKAVMKISAGCLNEYMAPLRPPFLTASKNTQVKENLDIILWETNAQPLPVYGCSSSGRIKPGGNVIQILVEPRGGKDRAAPPSPWLLARVGSPSASRDFLAVPRFHGKLMRRPNSPPALGGGRGGRCLGPLSWQMLFNIPGSN